MRYTINLRIGSALVLALGLGLAGCTRAPSGVPPPEPTTIPVSYPAQREITDFVDFTGRTEAIESVDIRPRTTGYLVRIPFKEGSDVKAGDLLFVIDLGHRWGIVGHRGQTDFGASGSGASGSDRFRFFC